MNPHQPNILVILTSNLSKAHETCDNLSSFCPQLALVYPQQFRCNLPTKCVPLLKTGSHEPCPRLVFTGPRTRVTKFYARVYGPCSRLPILCPMNTRTVSMNCVHEPCHCNAKYSILGAILQKMDKFNKKKYCFVEPVSITAYIKRKKTLLFTIEMTNMPVQRLSIEDV